jgi:WD40 repeat protein
MPGKPAYDAFISYSHAADSALAPAFRLALHRFAKPWYKARALSVFLDQSSLSANPGLWTAIERALSSAGHFLLLASPESAASPWVRKEIDWWLQNRSIDSMLVLLTGGDVIWDPAAGDFDWKRTTSISPELAGSFPAEPLYVDLRWAKDEGTYSLRSPRFRAAVLDVAAPLHGRNKDELDGEDIRQGRRTMRLARGAVAVIALAAGVAVWQAVVANQQRREAELQRDEAVRQRDMALSRRLVSDAERQRANPFQWNLSTLLAIESLRKALTAENYELLVRLMRDGARTVASFPGGYVAAFSPDSRLIATQAGEDLVIREARGGRALAKMEAAATSFSALCFSPDSTRVLGYSRDEAILFDVAARRQIAFPREIERGGAVDASPNCRFFTAARDGRGTLIALETNTLLGEFPLPATFTALATSDDGDSVAYAVGDRVSIVSGRARAVRTQWQAGQDVTGIAFDRAAKWLTVSIGTRGMVKVDAATGKPVANSAARGVVSPGGDLSVDLEKEGQELVAWNVESGAWERRLALRRSATNLHWSDDAEFVGYGSGQEDGSARIVQSDSWRQLARFAFPISDASTTLIFDPSPVRVRVSPSGDLASAANNSRAAVFEIHHDRPIVTLPPNLNPGPVALSGDGQRVGFRTREQQAVVIDVASGRELASLECRRTGRRQPMQLSRNGRFLAVSCGDVVLAYDTESRREVVNQKIDFGGTITLSRDGEWLFAGSAGLRRLDGTPVREVGRGHAAAFDDQGRRIAVAARSEVSMFDLRSSAPPLTIDAAISELESVAFSGDGALLAVGGRDMRVKIFDAATGNLLRLLEQVEPDQFVFRVHHLTFSPSGRLIATIADDPTLTDVGRPGTVRVFEVGTGREIARIPFPELAHDLRFAQDESFFEVAVGRRRIRWERYPLSAEALIKDACGYVQRNLDALEWARFMGDEPQRETCPGAGKYTTPP